VETVNNLQKDDKREGEKDQFWDKPPAVKLFLLARQAVWLQMQQVSAMPAAQLLRVLDIQVATWPTFLEAVQHFPGACGVKCELAETLQKHIDEAKVGIRDLELGSRLFLADLLERSADIIMRNSDGCFSRKLVEAEFARAFKRSGESNQAVQSVCQALKAPSVPTPSWKDTVGTLNDAPRALGAAYRLGGQEATSMSARRKVAGRETVRMAAQQERAVGASTPPTEHRYRNAYAVNTLRKMLKEDPELSNLPAEQQLRVAARRINRRIDFAEVSAKELGAIKRSASQREDDDHAKDGTDSPAEGNKPELKAKRSNAQRNSKNGGAASVAADGGDGDDSGSSASSKASRSSDGEASTEESEEDSDDEGTRCGSSDEDSRESEEDYISDDGFCVKEDTEKGSDADAARETKKLKKMVGKSASNAVKVGESTASKRDSSVNSLGTPNKSEGASSVSQGGNIYFGEDELKKWTTGSEKYKQGFNWPAYRTRCAVSAG
jgi:hypothetical protein